MMEYSGLRCKKCLLRETDEAGFFQNLYDYIERLNPEDKVSDEEYEARLAVCKTCDHLMTGMCRVCGCYVELRAAMKVKRCPAPTPRW